MSPRVTLRMQSVPTAGRWAIYIGLAVAFAIACVFLSQWQFGRNDDRTAELALVERNYDAEPVQLDELLPEGAELDEGDEWRPVVLTGTYQVEDQLLVRNRPHGGTSAYEVLTPLLLEDGRVIVVDRGWIAPPSSPDDAIEVPEPPEGEVVVIARLRVGEALPSSGRSAPEGQVPTIHLPLIAETTGPATITDAYALMASEDPAAASTPEALEAPSEDPGPHLSYAIQWILFAIMGFVFIGYIIRTEIRAARQEREQPEPEDGGGAAPPSVAPAPRRRRDRDEEAEDAILDDALR